MLVEHPRNFSSLVWITPRSGMDPSIRLRTHGRIRPLAEDMTLWERIFRR